MIISTTTKQYCLCPQCESAITFQAELLEQDFALINGSTYRYFGAVNPQDNIKCLYCQSQMQRGSIITLLRYVNPNGTVYRAP